MAKTTFYGINPISDSTLTLNDFSGTPNTEVRLFVPRLLFDQETVSFVGCTDGFTANVNTREANIFCQVEIQTRSMDELYTKINEIYTALQGDTAVPTTSTRGKFHFITALDGSTYYGYINCVRTGMDVNLRAYQRDGSTDFPLVDPPHLTLVTIQARTSNAILQQIPS